MDLEIKNCTPEPGESEDEFIGRCVGIMESKGRDPSQAAAICHRIWDEPSSKATIAPEAGRRKWWEIKNQTDECAELCIFDEIGFWGSNARDFKESFDKVKKSKLIKLTLNSPGGSFPDGMAIYNMIGSIRNQVEIEVVGLAASIASIIALAGKKLTIANGAYYMIHKPYAIADGNADDFRKAADVLDKMDNNLAEIYARKTGKDIKEIHELMDAETWMTAEEAVDMGFADEVVDYGEIAAKLPDISKYGFQNAPIALAQPIEQKPKIETERQFEKHLRDAGFSKTEAQIITAKGFKALRGEPEAPQGEPVKEPDPPDYRYSIAVLEAEECAKK